MVLLFMARIRMGGTITQIKNGKILFAQTTDAVFLDSSSQPWELTDYTEKKL